MHIYVSELLVFSCGTLTKPSNQGTILNPLKSGNPTCAVIYIYVLWDVIHILPLYLYEVHIVLQIVGFAYMKDFN